MRKRRWGHGGGWRQKGRKAGHVNQGDLLVQEPVFMPEEGRRSRASRSQSAQSSEEGP